MKQKRIIYHCKVGYLTLRVFEDGEFLIEHTIDEYRVPPAEAWKLMCALQSRLDKHVRNCIVGCPECSTIAQRGQFR